MSADGEVNVAVKAEGVDQAAGEMGGDTLAQTGQGQAGPGAGDDDRGGGGRFGRLLTRIAALLAFLGPILKVVQVVSEILEAFVAPLAIVLLRLLQPALRLLIQVLPVWFDIVNRIGDMIQKAKDVNLILAAAIGILRLIDASVRAVENAIPDDLSSAIRSLPRRIWNFVKQLDTMIGNAVVDALPNIGGGPSDSIDTSDTVETAARGAELGTDITQALGITPGGPLVELALEGGLDAFVERIERDPNTNIQ